MWTALKEYFSEFKILKKTPREFWIMNLVINFFEMLAYFAFITVLTLFLTDNLGLSDQSAGNIMAGFTLTLTVIMFFAGFIIDSIGVKRALMISMILLIPCRLLLGFMDHFETMYLKGSIDATAVKTLVEKEGFDKSAFTRDTARYQGAQIDVAHGAPAGVLAKAMTSDEYKADAKALHDAFVAVAKADPQVQATYGASFDQKIKDTKEYQKIVVSMVASRPALSAKYFTDFNKVAPGDLKDKLISTIKLIPELRERYTPQNMLWAAIIAILFFTAIGEALMSPAIYTALRRYTNRRTSGTGFNFQYLTMNVGAVMSYQMFDPLRDNFGNESIIIVGSFFAVICTIGVFFLRGNIEVAEDEECTIIERPEKKPEDREMPWTIMMSVFKEASFWRFMLFLILLLGVKLNFTHQFMIMPKYYDRVLGSLSAIGLLNSINPFIIVFGLILMIPILNKFKVFDLIVVGTTISAVSVFTLIVPGKWFTGFGLTIEQGYLVTILAQIVIFAIGELIWSPRLSEYTVTIAPKGREGTYMSLAALPMFIAKPLNGWLSGFLLTRYCPKDVMEGIVSGATDFANSPEMMWLILGLISISSPILVVLLRKVIENPADQVQV